ncbi:MAG: methyltransferase domain-containing protein [Flavobacteriales bacterium]|nr:methyltransferase domain-containing protein [Flavobacteriales bacterium]
MNLDKDFWNNRYAGNQIGWDLGAPSTPLKEFVDTLEDKSIRILIPGCGNAYEAEYLHQQGFENVFVIDIAPLALEGFKKRVPEFPADHLILGDFFEHEAEYDLILEQTFFCALDPKLRSDYAKKMHDLLAPNGKLAGVMFCFELTEQGPPFGGSATEYEGYFGELFEIKSMQPCLNSIKPRLGNELWVELLKN